MAFIRKIKKKNAVYLAEVESYRENGKVKQKVLRYIGKEVNGEVVRKIATSDIEVETVKQYLDYKTLHDLAGQLEMTELFGDASKYILLLVYTQIIARKSLYKLPEHIENTVLKELLSIDKLADKHLYEALDKLEEMDFSVIEQRLFKKLSAGKQEKTALVLDITDTYFSGSQAEWKSRKGKDGKYGKLIQIALAVTKEEGFPILHNVYEGNVSDIKIFQDMITSVRLQDFDVIVLDRGMISYESLNDLTMLGQKVITGLRLNRKLKAEYLDRIDRNDIFNPANLVPLKNTKVFIKSFQFKDGTLIVVYNPSIEISKRMGAINKDKFDIKKAKYYGYSLIYHTTDMLDENVVREYYEKDIVEKAFKELKSSINLHPVRKYLLTRVKAHIKICYLAYVLLSSLQYKLKPRNISAVYALEKLQPAYKVELKSNKEHFKWSKIVTLTNEQKTILKLLGCSV